jgi:hypothetical protein
MAGLRGKRLTFGWAAMAFLLFAPAKLQAAEPDVLLQGLDKVTARVSRIGAQIGQSVRFGTLEIVVRACHKRPPEEPPESTAFLEITEQTPGQPAAKLFTGWMFASSPALNPLEHPVYDVWLIDCKATAPGIDGARQ